MGFDIGSKVSDKSRNDFKKKNMESDFDYKMGDEDDELDFGSWGSSSSDSKFDSGFLGSSSNFGSGGSSSWGSSWGGGGASWNQVTGGGFGFGNNQKSEKDMDDKMMEAFGVAAKGSFSFMKAVVGDFGKFDKVKHMRAGRRIFVTSVAFLVVGLVFYFMGFPVGKSFFFPSILCGSFGTFWFWRYYKKLGGFGSMDEPISGFGGENNEVSDSGLEGGTSFLDGIDFGDDDSWSDVFSSDEDEDEVDFGGSSSSGSFYGGFDGGSSGGSYFSHEGGMSSPEEVESKIEQLAGQPVVSRGTLYDFYMDMLRSISPSFAEVKEIPDYDKTFEDWQVIVSQACEALRTKEGDADATLLEVKENVLFYYLRIEKPSWLKSVNSFVTEMVNIVSFNSNTGEISDDITGTGHQVGKDWYIRIMRGASPLISVKDIMMGSEDKEWVKDTHNKMPVFMGVNEFGKVVKYDFVDVHSMLVAGQPRSGKTWTVLSIIIQIMMWNSPDNVIFHILDPKDRISDYTSITGFPFVKRFESKDEGVMAAVRDIVKVEAVRRTKILADNGVLTIEDLHKKCPDVKLPYLYVVIDEVITFAERMDKPTFDEFMGLLLELITRLPSMGVRAILLPHTVKDTVLKKTITDMIPIRINVRGNAEEIKRTTGDSSFPFKLGNKGCCALAYGNKGTQYMQSTVIDKDLESLTATLATLGRFFNKIYKTDGSESVSGVGSENSLGGTLSGARKAPKTTWEAPKLDEEYEKILDDNDSSQNTLSWD